MDVVPVPALVRLVEHIVKFHEEIQPIQEFIVCAHVDVVRIPHLNGFSIHVGMSSSLELVSQVEAKCLCEAIASVIIQLPVWSLPSVIDFLQGPFVDDSVEAHIQPLLVVVA